MSRQDETVSVAVAEEAGTAVAEAKQTESAWVWFRS